MRPRRNCPGHTQAYVEMMVAESTLDDPFTIDSDSDCNDYDHPAAMAKLPSTVLSLLAQKAPTQPNLLNLVIRCSMDTAKLGLLSSALNCHTDLQTLEMTCMDLCSSNTITSAISLFHAMSRLANLTSLTLTFKQSPTSFLSAREADAIRSLTAVINALPNLADFDLTVQQAAPQQRRRHACDPHHRPHSLAHPFGRPAYRPQKRVKLAARRPQSHAAGSGTPTPPPTPASLDRLVTALSTAPALTSLSLSFIGDSKNPRPLLCSGLHGPLTSLQHVMIDASESRVKQEALKPACKPLPATSMPSLTSFVFNHSRAIVCPTDVSDIMSSAALQPALRSLELSIPFTCTAGLQQLRTSICSIPQLAELNLVLDSGDGVEEVPVAAICGIVQGIAQLTALTSLDILLPNVIGAPSGAGGSTDDVTRMLQPLSTLTSLQHFLVQVQQYPPHPHSEAASLADTISHLPLGEVPKLTFLSLSVLRDTVSVGCLRCKLSPLTKLRSLVLESFCSQDGFEAAQVLEECLVPLPGLGLLRLTVHPFDVALVAAVSRSAVGMPELEKVTIPPCGEYSASLSEAHPDWPYGLLELPARGQYEFVTVIGKRGLFDEVCGKLAARGATVVEGLICQKVTFTR